MPHSVFTQTFRELEKPVLAWGLALAVYSLVVVGFFPVLEAYPDFAAGVQDLLGHFQSFAGINEPVTTPTGFLNTTSFILILPALLAIFSILATDRIYVQESERGYLQVLLAQPIPRWRLALHKFSALALATGMIAALLWGIYAWRSTALALHLNLLNLAWVMFGLVLISLFFGALTMVFGALPRTARLSKTLALIALALAYLFYLAPHLSPELNFLEILTPIWYLFGSNPLVNGINVFHAFILLFLTGGLTSAALILFERKDL